jgi:hypothetical protein
LFQSCIVLFFVQTNVFVFYFWLDFVLLLLCVVFIGRFCYLKMFSFLIGPVLLFVVFVSIAFVYWKKFFCFVDWFVLLHFVLVSFSISFQLCVRIVFVHCAMFSISVLR